MDRIGSIIRAMTTINNQDDFLEALRNNPQWRDAVRAQILGEDLMQLPKKFDDFVEEHRTIHSNIDARLDRMDARLDRMEGDFGTLKGDFARNRTIQDAGNIAHDMGLEFLMEIASRSTDRQDVEAKRPAYAALGIPEYWRFDQTGDFHGTGLAGDRLVEDCYEPVPIEALEEGILQGYSAVQDLFIRWEHGELRWHDPATGQHIVTFEDQRNRADAADAGIRELEEELRRRETRD